MSNQNFEEQAVPEQENPAMKTGQEAVEQQDTAETPAQETPAEPVKTETELLTEKIDQLNDQLLRTMAEYDNFRKRSQREKEAIYPQATASAVEKFVPIIDTFERALGAPCSDPEFKKGVEMILSNFIEVLKKQGVEEFGAPGDQFDPAFHNAVMHVEDDSVEANSIVEVFQKGYRMGDRIIRHAMVKVVN